MSLGLVALRGVEPAGVQCPFGRGLGPLALGNTEARTVLIGPALALGMLSALSAERVVRAIREKDILTLQSVPRVGRKKAEQLILDLADKLDDIQAASGVPGRRVGVEGEAPGAEDAIRALVALGYSSPDAERAVRTALDDGARGMNAPELIRRALAKVGGR